MDTSALLDVLTDNPVWGDWSRDRLAPERGRLFADPLVYAEASVAYRSAAAFEDALSPLGLTVRPAPREALFLAGKAHAAYRARGGTRAAILPDFVIAAHAAVAGLPLITRDTVRIVASFPTLRLIAPGHV